MFKFASFQVLTTPTKRKIKRSAYQLTVLLSQNQFNKFIHFIPKKAKIIFFLFYNCYHNTQAEPLAGKKFADFFYEKLLHTGKKPNKKN